MAWPDRTDRRLIGLTLAVKLGVLVVGALAYTLIAQHQISSLYDALAIWNRWDAPHYLDLIVFGYRAHDPGNLVGPHGYQQVYPGDLGLYIVFFPLFPWLATAVNAILGDPLLSAFAVSTAEATYWLSSIDSRRSSRFCLLIRRGLASTSGRNKISSSPGTT